MTTGNVQPIESLSTYELLAGLLLFLGKRPISEQGLLRFLSALQEREPEYEKLQITGSPKNLISRPVRRVLTILEMGKVLIAPQPNPVDQSYQLRTSMHPSLEKELRSRGVLPAHAPQLKRLARELRSTLPRSTTEWVHAA